MKKPTILIVDDDPDYAESLGLNLEIEGYSVEFASSGEDAVRKLEHQEFGVTLLDYRMPGMNGVECLREIRKRHPDAKVIITTAYSADDLRSQSLLFGATGTLQKPIASKTLLRALCDICPLGTILIVDDDTDFVEGIESTLTEAGYDVIKAHTGEQALATALDTDIDVLLLDIRLPDMNGLDMYLELEKRGHNPPTIVMTGFSAEESATVDELLRLSATTCLVKPVKSADLLRAIEDTDC